MAEKSVNLFFEASSKGDIDTLEKLYTGHTMLTMTDADGKNALHFAALEGKVESIEWLVQKGFAVDTLTKKGLTPFHFAVFKGKKEAAQLLAAAGCDTTLADATGRTALHLACVAGSLELVQWLVFDANLSPLDVNNEGMHAAHFAALGGHTAVMEWLCTEAGAATDSTTHAGMTCMHLAAMKGHLDTVQWLAAPSPNGAGLPVNTGDLKKRTPLHLAVVSQHAETVRYLLEMGADPRQPDAEGKSAERLAAGILASNTSTGSAAERVRDLVAAASAPPLPTTQPCLISQQVATELNVAVEEGEVPPEEGEACAPKLPSPGYGVSSTRAWVRWDAPDVPPAGKPPMEYMVQVAPRMQAKMGMGWADAVCMIMRGNEEGAWVERTVSTTTHCVACITGLTGGKDYCVRVKAKNINGWGPFSKPEEISTIKSEEPAAPSSATATSSTTTEIQGKGGDSAADGAATVAVQPQALPPPAVPTFAFPDPTLPQSLIEAVSQGDAAALSAFEASEEAGDDVRGVDVQGRTVLHHAAQAGAGMLLKAGISRGVAVDARDKIGATALLLAVVAGQLAAVRSLVLAGASVDAADLKGYSALHYAAIKGRYQVFRWLCEAGADPSVKTAKGQSVKALLESRLSPQTATAPASALSKEDTAACQYMLTVLANAENVPAAPPVPSFADATRYSLIVHLPWAKWVPGCPAPFACEVQFTRRTGMGLGLSPFWSTASETLPSGVNIFSSDYLSSAVQVGGAPVADAETSGQVSNASDGQGEGDASAAAATPNKSAPTSKPGLYTSVSFAITGLKPDSQYVAQVRCRNARGWGPWSARSTDMATRKMEDKHAPKPDLLLAVNAAVAASNLLSTELGTASGRNVKAGQLVKIPASAYHRPAEILADPIAAGVQAIDASGSGDNPGGSVSALDMSSSLELGTSMGGQQGEEAHKAQQLLSEYVDVAEHVPGMLGIPRNTIIEAAGRGELLHLANVDSGDAAALTLQELRRGLLRVADKLPHASDSAMGQDQAASALDQHFSAIAVPEALLTDAHGMPCTPRTVLAHAASAAAHAGSTDALMWLLGCAAEDLAASPKALDSALPPQLSISQTRALSVLDAACAASDADARGLLHAAAAGGHIGTVRCILAGLAGHEISASDANVRRKLATVLRRTKTRTGCSAVHSAAYGADADCLGWLLSLQEHDRAGEQGEHSPSSSINASASETDSSNGWSVLHYAAAGGSSSCIHLLTDAMGVLPLSTDKEGRTAMHIAAAANMVHVLQVLHEKDPKLCTVADAGGMLPIHYACAGDCALALAFLLSVGSARQMRARDAAGRTAMDVAVKAGSSAAMLLLLQAASNASTAADWRLPPVCVTASRTGPGEVTVSWLEGKAALLYLFKQHAGGMGVTAALRSGIDAASNACLGSVLDSVQNRCDGQWIRVEWAVQQPAAMQPSACFAVMDGNMASTGGHATHNKAFGCTSFPARGKMDHSSRIELLSGLPSNLPLVLRVRMVTSSSGGEVLATSDIVSLE